MLQVLLFAGFLRVGALLGAPSWQAVQGLGLTVWDLGFIVWGLGFRVSHQRYVWGSSVNLDNHMEWKREQDIETAV